MNRAYHHDTHEANANRDYRWQKSYIHNHLTHFWASYSQPRSKIGKFVPKNLENPWKNLGKELQNPKTLETTHSTALNSNECQWIVSGILSLPSMRFAYACSVGKSQRPVRVNSLPPNRRWMWPKIHTNQKIGKWCTHKCPWCEGWRTTEKRRRKRIRLVSANYTEIWKSSCVEKKTYKIFRLGAWKNLRCWEYQ